MGKGNEATLGIGWAEEQCVEKSPWLMSGAGKHVDKDNNNKLFFSR